MSQFKSLIRTTYANRIRNYMRAYLDWHKRGYAAPSPHFIKQTCLLRNGVVDGTWIETGTYLGETTHLLSKRARQVYSIEPEPTLFANAQRRFKNFANVEIINGVSETVLPALLPKVSGDVSFWLDGHYSHGVTFQGVQECPIDAELNAIASNRARFGQIRVMVDDIRLFSQTSPDHAGYPALDVLIQWAKDQKLAWHIEHDIFVARN